MISFKLILNLKIQRIPYQLRGINIRVKSQKAALEYFKISLVFLRQKILTKRLMLVIMCPRFDSISGIVEFKTRVK